MALFVSAGSQAQEVPSQFWEAREPQEVPSYFWGLDANEVADREDAGQWPFRPWPNSYAHDAKRLYGSGEDDNIFLLAAALFSDYALFSNYAAKSEEPAPDRIIGEPTLADIPWGGSGEDAPNPVGNRPPVPNGELADFSFIQEPFDYRPFEFPYPPV